MNFSLLISLSLTLVSQRVRLATAAYDVEQPYPQRDSRVPLYFSLIQSFSGQYISAYSLPGLQLALDLINNDTTLLPGYSLHFIFTDAPVSRYLARLYTCIFYQADNVAITFVMYLYTFSYGIMYAQSFV